MWVRRSATDTDRKCTSMHNTPVPSRGQITLETLVTLQQDTSQSVKLQAGMTVWTSFQLMAT